MSDAKWLHYIPEMLQQHFVDPDCPPNYEPYVCVRELGSTRWRKRAPKNVGAETNYYRIDEPDPPLRFEKGFTLLEGDASRTIPKMLEGIEPDETEMHRLAMFIAMLKVRVPANIEPVEAALHDEGRQRQQKFVEFCKANPEFFERAKREFAEARGKPVPSLSPDDLLRATLVPSRGHVLQTAMYSVPDVAIAIRSLHWTLYRSAFDHFVLSDDPVLTGHTSNGELGLFALPIARSAVLIGVPGEPGFSFAIARRPLVGFINSAMARSCTRFVISPKPYFIERTKIVEPFMRLLIQESSGRASLKKERKYVAAVDHGGKHSGTIAHSEEPADLA